MADAPGICMAPLLSSRQAFTAAYKEFCDSTGTKYRDEYPMHGTHFTVFELWRAIQDRGGFTQVSASKAWGATARSFLPAEALADRQWESVASDIKRTYAQRLKLCTLEEQMRGQEQQQQEQQQSQQQQQGNIADADATAHAATPIGTPGGTIGADGALLSVDAALSGPGRTTDTVMRDALGAGIAAEGGTEGASEGDSRSSSESEEVHSGGEGPAGLACMCTRAGTAIGLSATFAWKRKREPASGSGEVDSCAENNDVAASGAAAADVTDTDNDTPRTKKLGCQHGHAPGVQQDSRAPQLPQQQQQEQQQQQTPGSAAAPPTASSIGSAEQRTGATTPRGAELDPVAAAAGTIAAKPAPNSWLTADTAGADAESDVAAAAAALLQASEAAAACWPSALRGGPGSGGKKPGGHGQPPGARPVPRGHPRSLPQMMLKQRMPAGAAAPPSASKVGGGSAGSKQRARRVGVANPEARRLGPCNNCCSTKSPQWRQGPPAKPVLCNACGLHFGRHNLLPPALPIAVDMGVAPAQPQLQPSPKAKRVRTMQPAAACVAASPLTHMPPPKQMRQLPLPDLPVAGVKREAPSQRPLQPPAAVRVDRPAAAATAAFALALVPPPQLPPQQQQQQTPAGAAASPTASDAIGRGRAVHEQRTHRAGTTAPRGAVLGPAAAAGTDAAQLAPSSQHDAGDGGGVDADCDEAVAVAALLGFPQLSLPQLLVIAQQQASKAPVGSGGGGGGGGAAAAAARPMRAASWPPGGGLATGGHCQAPGARPVSHHPQPPQQQQQQQTSGGAESASGSVLPSAAASCGRAGLYQAGASDAELDHAAAVRSSGDSAARASGSSASGATRQRANKAWAVVSASTAPELAEARRVEGEAIQSAMEAEREVQALQASAQQQAAFAANAISVLQAAAQQQAKHAAAAISRAAAVASAERAAAGRVSAWRASVEKAVADKAAAEEATAQKLAAAKRAAADARKDAANTLALAEAAEEAAAKDRAAAEAAVAAAQTADARAKAAEEAAAEQRAAAAQWQPPPCPL